MMNLEEIKNTFDNNPLATTIIQILWDDSYNAKGFKVLYSNEAVLGMYDETGRNSNDDTYSVESVAIGKSIAEMCINVAKNGGSSTTFMRLTDGRFVNVIGYNCLTDCCLCHVIDVTNEISENEKQTIKAKERLFQLERTMRFNPTWIFTCLNNLEWTMLTTNHGLYDMIGYTEDELKTQCNNSIGSLIPTEDRIRVRGLLSKLKKGEENVCYETPAYKKDGSLVYLYVSVFISLEDSREVLYASCSDITLLHNTQLESKKQADQLNHMVNTIPGGAMTFKVTERLELQYYSENIPALTGNTADEFDEIIGRSDIVSLVYSADKIRFRTMAQDAINNLDGSDDIFRLIDVNSNVVWVHGFCKVIGKEDGYPLLYIVMINMSEESRLYQEALDQTNEMVVVSDRNTYELLYANRAAAELGGKEPRAYTGLHCYEYINNNSDVCSFCVANKFDRTSLKVFETERDGKFYSTKGRVIDWNGREAVIEYVSDITEQHNSKVNTMLDRDMLMLAMKTVYPMCIAVNLTKNSYYMLEYDNFATKKADDNGIYDELIDVGASTIHPNERKDFVRLFNREAMIKSYYDGVKTIQLVHRQIGDEDSVWHWNETTVIFIENDYNDDILEISVTKCVDKEKADEQQKIKRQEELEIALDKAETADKAKTEFLANISHDMRTPLNGILGFTTLARESTDIIERNDFLDKIATSGQYLLGLINDTLDLSKLESGKITINPENIISEDLIKNIFTTQLLTAKAKGVTLELNKENVSRVMIKTDPLRVQEIFINLISNAIKFTPSGGRVVISVERINNKVDCLRDRITVADNGVGMSEEFAKKAFEPFSQENPFETLKSGTGLGLSIVKNIVELMNGTISFTTKKGVGTTFVVELDFPLVKNRDEKPAEKYESLTQLNGKRILLCEDHPLNIELAKRLLQKHGMEVFVATDGKMGVEAFASSDINFYDAILMDIRMPNMNGLDAAKAIRAIKRDDAKTIPIIAMTANAYDDDRDKSKEAGMNAHIAKPIDPQLLYDTLRNNIK